MSNDANFQIVNKYSQCFLACAHVEPSSEQELTHVIDDILCLLTETTTPNTHMSVSAAAAATATIESHEWMEHCVYCLFICHSSSKREIKRFKKKHIVWKFCVRFFFFVSRFVNVDLSFTPSLLRFAQISMKSNHFMRDFCFSFNSF